MAREKIQLTWEKIQQYPELQSRIRFLGAQLQLGPLLRERLPKLESAVKRGMKILDDQDAIKAHGAGRGVDIADIEFDFTPEQAEAELQSIAAQVTLQIDVVEKLHAAIMHDEALAIEGKEPKALLEATQTFLLEDQRVLALPAPSKPKI